ncbi:MAG: MBL fold metallo-hydrolase [Pirellulales bacterium]|nr:MBL fold metallo-hydrolase [Pirellulales bacterium]
MQDALLAPSPHRTASGQPTKGAITIAAQPDKPTPVSADIHGQLVFLGTGTSVGVPALGCGCDVCQSTNAKNHRTRCAVILGLPQGNLLIDTPPDLRMQLLREGIGVAHAVLFTHSHADHLFGLDDLRLLPFYLGHAVPIYCNTETESRIRKSFDYAFSDKPDTHDGATPKLEIRNIDLAAFSVLGTRVIPILLKHGHWDVLGFRFGDVAYCTDVNAIPDASWPLLEGLDVLVLDALRNRPHVTHFSLEEAVETAKRIGARQTYFTHMSHELEHEATNAMLPERMQLAYDGLRIALS